MNITSEFFSFNVWVILTFFSSWTSWIWLIEDYLPSWCHSTSFQYFWCLEVGFHCVKLLSDLFQLSRIRSQYWLWVADHVITRFTSVGIRTRLWNQVISFLFSLSICFASVSFRMSSFLFWVSICFLSCVYSCYSVVFWVLIRGKKEKEKESNQKMLFGFRQVSNTSWDYHHSFVFACFLVFNDFWINHTHTHTHIYIDANLVITWSCNPHAKTPIPGKPSKSCLIGVWHKDNLYLGTSTLENGDPHPTNIDSRTRSIRMTPQRQLFFDKSFSVL